MPTTTQRTRQKVKVECQESGVVHNMHVKNFELLWLQQLATFPLFALHLCAFATILFLATSCQQNTSDFEQNARYQKIPSTQSNITFANELAETEAFNIIEYLYFYNGGGVATGDVNNDGLPDIYFTANQLPNKLYLNKGNFQFEDITEQAGVAGTGDWKTGVTMADVNADGWLDIYVCQVGDYKGLSGNNQLFINQQDGTFVEKAAEYGLDFKGFSTQAAFFDYDMDGDLDLFLLNHSVHSTENYGDIRLRDQRDSLTGDRLYQNNSLPLGQGGRFTEVTQQAGIISSQIGYGLDVTLSDVDGNGCPDIYVSNDFHENDYLYYNNCDGTFREGITKSVGHTTTFSMGNEVADVNNDGRSDILSLDMKPEDETILKSSVGADPYNIYQFKLQFGYHYQFPHNALQINQGKLFGDNTQFSEVAQLAGIAATDWSWSVLAHDMNNDGWKDLFITNGIWRRPNDLDYLKFISNQQIQQSASDMEMARQMPKGLVPNYAFANAKNLTFENTAEAWGLAEVGCSNGAAYADFDQDGDLDLVINNLNAEASIFENKTNEQASNHFLQLRLQGRGKNTHGIGTKVLLWQNDRLQYQEQFPVRGFQSSVDYTLHFGLGESPTVDSLKIIWPTGEQQLLFNPPTDTLLVIDQANAQSRTANTQLANNQLTTFQRTTTNIPFRHTENNFIDFDQEKLMPRMLSREGPALAVADVNGDGLDDVFCGGASGQFSALFFQLADGSFRAETRLFSMDAAAEDVDAVFFDLENDGDLDLYVVAGSGENQGTSDRLYENIGQGILQQKPLSLAEQNGSCVVAADFNADGYTDLFVGSRSVPRAYGEVPKQTILLNDGKGNLASTANYPELENLGMVTDAVWLENDRQLVVVGEWLPVTIFDFSESEVTTSTIENSSGWWNTVETADIDVDGDLDLLLGNWGLNSDLQASAEKPVGLYVHDFDGNGSTDPILTYYKQNQPYTYVGKDDLINQIVVLRKQFPNYTNFAQSTLQDIFSQQDLEKAKYQQAQTFTSAYAENQGDGTFELRALPREAQFAPIYAFAAEDFDGDGKMDIVAAGNQYDTQPIIGKMDASYGTFLKGDGQGNFQYIEPLESGFAVQGQVRAMQFLEKGGQQQLLVARNDTTLVSFSFDRLNF